MNKGLNDGMNPGETSRVDPESELIVGPSKLEVILESRSKFDEF
jgi:hypothetical protein